MEPNDIPPTHPWETWEKQVVWEDQKTDGWSNINVGEFSESVFRLIDAWDRASRKAPEYSKLLTTEQMERALWLGLSTERVENLGYLIGLCLTTLKKILDTSTGVEWAMQYLNKISISLASQEPLKIEKEEIPKDELEKLIGIIFSEENMRYGVPYILSYFLWFLDKSLEEQTINFRVLTGLLDYWRSIWKDHDHFGIVADEFSTDMTVFNRYTAYVDERYWYFSVVLLSKQKRVEREDYAIPAFHDIPDTFARIGMNDGTEIDNEIDVGHYETIFILWGKVYQYIRPAVKWLRGFIKKHQTYLSLPWNAPWEGLRPGEEKAWQWAKRFLEFQLAQKDTKEPVVPKNPPKAWRKNKGQLRPPVVLTPSAWPILHSQATTFPAPTLRETLQETLWNGSVTSEIPPSLICSDILEGALLCIGRRASRGWGKTLEWDNKKYEHDEAIHFPPINPGESIEYFFCYLWVWDARVPGKSLPHTTLTISRPKERSIPIINAPDTSWLRKNVPAKVTWVLDTRAPQVPSQPPEVRKEDSQAEVFALDILSRTSEIRVSRKNKNTISVSIEGIDGFMLDYDPATQTYARFLLPEGVDSAELFTLVGDEFLAPIAWFLAQEKEEQSMMVAWKLAFTSYFLRTKFGELGDITKFQNNDAFILTRTREGSWAFVFTPRGNQTYRRFIDEFRTFLLEEYGIYFEIRVAEKEEVSITLSLKDEDWISATITSKNPPPPVKPKDGEKSVAPKMDTYYEISDLSHLENTIREQLSEVLIQLLLFLGAAGRSLMTEGKIATTWGYEMNRDGVIELYRRGFRSATETREKDEAERAWEIIKKMRQWTPVKSCTKVELIEIKVPGSWKIENVPIFHISKRKNGESKGLLQDGSDDVRMIYRDECLAFMRSGSGHANIYERIRANPYLQKYLALRMAYAINAKLLSDEIRDPIPEFAAAHLLSLWSTFSDEIQQSFIRCFERGNDGRISKALEVEVQPGVTLFSLLVGSLEENGVKMIHHEPGMISLGKIRKYLKDDASMAWK